MLYLLLALLAGAFLPLQAAINATLRAPLGHAVWAALLSFCVGAISLLGFGLATRLPLPASLSGLALWQWSGGIMGAFIVATTIFLTPKLGLMLTFGLVVSGQMLASLVLDHMGWLGVPQHPLNTPRVLGALFLLAGVVLIRRF